MLSGFTLHKGWPNTNVCLQILLSSYLSLLALKIHKYMSTPLASCSGFASSAPSSLVSHSPIKVKAEASLTLKKFVTQFITYARIPSFSQHSLLLALFPTTFPCRTPFCFLNNSTTPSPLSTTPAEEMLSSAPFPHCSAFSSSAPSSLVSIPLLKYRQKHNLW